MPKAKGIESKAIDCITLGIETIIATIYNDEDDVVVKGGPWSCSSQTGSLSHVPEGNHYRLLIQARDENSIAQYRGLVSDISVTAGNDTDIGVVSLVPILGLEDADADGVPDDIDTCANTPANETPNSNGCSPSQLDSDRDGVTDDADTCPDTPSNDTPDANGCGYSQRITKIPDTGQTICYDEDGASIACPYKGEEYYGQDANYLIRQPSYTKLDSEGKDLPDSASSWAMVKDNITGLIWEVKTKEEGIHFSEKEYTWYDAHDVFIKRLNEDFFGGYNDWRIPTVNELTGILDYGTSSDLMANSDYFVNTMIDYYWTSMTDSSDTVRAWNVVFFSGVTFTFRKSGENYVRAVRGEIVPGNFRDNGDGTVSDMNTNLMWMQGTSETAMTWKDALSYCENLTLAGHSDWRLPNIQELRSIVDYNSYNPDDPVAINKRYFTGTESTFYWTSTTWDVSGEGCNVSFEDGWSLTESKLSLFYVRAVRGGQ